ncbi:carboxypeptidase regulatory-like domain-containing protein [Roseisolibacter sp. H3M3-2]|uniref:TonB-dependent receptor n=1 Tax=Roseisolibacter sp. H3M3-2 TaxID=3031323 RepID=UPI0023DA6A6C|nr:carboxypeptidase regulatory-like domain-containing protein [Roseisolibacter sp. H3M3-2]MDF1501572.1 TonB-dependent receptor [Roseisolibacter sp. H3M3-2]
MRAIPLPRGALVLGALVLLGAPAASRAQTATASVRGYVTGGAAAGAAGAPVSDVQVVARDVATNQQRGTLTNAAGFYFIGGLRPGRWEITARRVGLTPQTRAVQLQIGQTLDLNLRVSEAAVTLSTVTVQAEAEGTEARTSEISTNVSREQIQNLPNFERNFLDIARLAPGITSQNVNSTDKTFAASGQPADAVNVFIDGATYKSDVLTGGVAGQNASKGNPFPQDAVQEFRVITQNYKAEYQRAGSAIITATTRSGSNTVEASAFGFNVNNALVSRDAFTAGRNGPRPQYKRWQAGGSLGAPIVRDKLFIFGTYELNQRTEPANVLFGRDSSFAPAALLAQLRPYTGGNAQEFRSHLGFAKITWNASAGSTVDASFSMRKDHDFRGFGNQTSYEARENLDIDVMTGIANWRLSGNRWLNEAQVSTQLYQWKPTWINGDLIGRQYNEILRIGGKDSQQDFDQTRVSLRDDVTRSAVQFAGDHVFKFGGNVDFLGYSAIKAQTQNPVFRFRRDEQYARPYEASFGFGDPRVETDNTQFGFYAQDDWTIGRRLVLNLGLRWDAETNMINNDYVTPQALADSLRGPLNAQLFVRQTIPDPANPAGTTTRNVRTVDMLGGIENFLSNGSNRPMYKKAWQPRLGASFDVFGDTRTVLFGGYGLYYDRTVWNNVLDEQFRRQFGVYTVTFRGTQAACAAETDAAVRNRCTAWDERYYDPAQLRSLTGSVGIPEVFLVKNDLVPPSTQQYSGGVRQAVGPTQVTLTYNGVRGRNFMNFVRGAYTIGTPGAARQNYAAVFLSDDRVKTWYDAVQLQVDKPIRGADRWGGSVAYTLGKSEEQGQSTDLFWGFDEKFPTVADRPRRRAPGDQRHKIVMNGVFRLPADITFSTIVNLASGITVNAADQTLGTGQFQSVTYTFTPPGRPFLGVGHVFAYQQVDVRLEKAIPVAGGNRVSVVADLFNAFNNANYGCFNTTIPPAGQTNANYGAPGCAGLGTRLQLGLRYAYRGAEGGGR